MKRNLLARLAKLELCAVPTGEYRIAVMKSLVPLGYAGETHELMVQLSPGRFELQERLGPAPRGVPCGIPNDGNHWIVMNEFEANS